MSVPALSLPVSASAAPSRSFPRRWLARPGVQRLLGGVVLLLVWQLAAQWRLNAYYVSSPVAVAGQIGRWVASGSIWPHLASTLATTLGGFVLAAIAGTVGAVAVGSSRLADRTLRPLVFIAYSMPKVVLAPVLVLWVGIGQPPALILAFITGFFMVFFNVHSGVRSVSAAQLNLAAILGAGPLATAWKIRLPAAAPFIATGLQQGLVYAFHGAIIGEMTASNTGIGYVIVFAATSMDSTAVIAALCLVGAFSYLLLAALAWATTRLTPGAAPDSSSTASTTPQGLPA